MAASIQEVIRGFSERKINLEQADRVQAIRNGFGSLACMVWQATRASEQRDSVISRLREIMLLAVDCIAAEAGEAGGDRSIEERMALLAKLEGELSKADLAKVRSLFGLVTIPEADGKKTGKQSTVARA